MMLLQARGVDSDWPGNRHSLTFLDVRFDRCRRDLLRPGWARRPIPPSLTTVVGNHCRVEYPRRQELFVNIEWPAHTLCGRSTSVRGNPW